MEGDFLEFFALFQVISYRLNWSIHSNCLGQPRKRLTHVYDLCKGKKICEGGDEMDLNPDNPDNQTNPVSFYFKRLRLQGAKNTPGSDRLRLPSPEL